MFNLKYTNGANGRVFYRGSELLGGKCSGREFSSLEMLKIFKNYERALLERNYKRVRLIESRNGYPRTWLNCVVSGLIMHSEKGLADKLIDEFKDRGYSEFWRKTGGKDIKAKKERFRYV